MHRGAPQVTVQEKRPMMLLRMRKSQMYRRIRLALPGQRGGDQQRLEAMVQAN